MLAPNPVLPNWGRSQFFTQGSAEGSEGRGRQGNRNEQGGESAKSAAAGEGAKGTAVGETTKSVTVSESAKSSAVDESTGLPAPTNSKAGETSEKESGRAGDEQQAPDSDKMDKGKGRAVSVEDADEE